MARRKSKIKSCIILNPPTTLEEQKAFEQTIAKALALALYRSLSSNEFNNLISSLQQKERKLV